MVNITNVCISSCIIHNIRFPFSILCRNELQTYNTLLRNGGGHVTDEMKMSHDLHSWPSILALTLTLSIYPHLHALNLMIYLHNSPSCLTKLASRFTVPSLLPSCTPSFLPYSIGDTLTEEFLTISWVLVNRRVFYGIIFSWWKETTKEYM